MNNQQITIQKLSQADTMAQLNTKKKRTSPQLYRIFPYLCPALKNQIEKWTIQSRERALTVLTKANRASTSFLPLLVLNQRKEAIR